MFISNFAATEVAVLGSFPASEAAPFDPSDPFLCSDWGSAEEDARDSEAPVKIHSQQNLSIIGLKDTKTCGHKRPKLKLAST